MAPRIPHASSEWVADLEKALWDAGFRLQGPEEHYVNKELYDDVARGLQSNRDLAEKYKRERDELADDLQQANDKLQAVRSFLR